MNHHELEHGHSTADLTLADKLATFADTYWPAFLITFGAAFLFSIPFHTGDAYFGKTIGHVRPDEAPTSRISPNVPTEGSR